MKHPIALVTGATSGLGYAAASMLAADGFSQVIVTGRSLARAKEAAAQLATETKAQVFTPLELDLNAATSVQFALAELVKRGRPIDFLLLNAARERKSAWAFRVRLSFSICENRVAVPPSLMWL